MSDINQETSRKRLREQQRIGSSPSNENNRDDNNDDDHHFLATKRRKTTIDTNVANLSNLPMQLLVVCFEFLPVNEIPALSTVNRFFYDTIFSVNMWTNAYMDLQVLKRRTNQHNNRGELTTDRFCELMERCRFAKLHLSCEHRLDWGRVVGSAIPQHCNVRLTKLKLTAICVSVEDLMGAIRACPNLVHLNIRHYIPLDDIHTSAINLEERKKSVVPAKLSKLKKLKLYVISDEDLEHHVDVDTIVPTERDNMHTLVFFLAKSCPRVESLTLAGNPTISWCTDEVLDLFSAHTGHIRKLLLSGLVDISDESLIGLWRHNPALEGVTIDGCNRITSHSLVGLSQHCTKLTALRLVNPDSLASNIEHVMSFHTLHMLQSFIVIYRKHHSETDSLQPMKRLMWRLISELVPDGGALKNCTIINIQGLKQLFSSALFQQKISGATQIELIKVDMDDDIVHNIISNNTNDVIKKLSLCQELGNLDGDGNEVDELHLSERTIRKISQKTKTCLLTNVHLDMRKLFTIQSEENSVITNLTLSAVNDTQQGEEVQQPEQSIQEEIRHSQLQKLSLCNMSAMTDNMFDFIAHSCPQLHKLMLHGMGSLTCRSILSVSQHCRKLEVLHIHDCPLFDEVENEDSATSFYSFENVRELKMDRFRIPQINQLFALLLNMKNVKNLTFDAWEGQIIVIRPNGISVILSNDIGCLLQLQSSILKEQKRGKLKFGSDRVGGFWQYELFCKVLQDLLGDDFDERFLKDGDPDGEIRRQLTDMCNVRSVERVSDSANGDNNNDDADAEVAVDFKFKSSDKEPKHGLALALSVIFQLFMRALRRVIDRATDGGLSDTDDSDNDERAAEITNS